MFGTLTPICTILLDLTPSLLCLTSFSDLVSTQVHWILSEQRENNSHNVPLEGRICRDCGLWDVEEGSSAMCRDYNSQGDMPSWTRRLSAAED